jgi:hypothetical protein
VKDEPTPIRGAVRKRMQTELDHYLAALNVDTQFAVRKAVFLVRSLELPKILTVREALYEIETRLALGRERFQFGRPWSFGQLKRAYWARQKLFQRVPPQPMVPAEWSTVKERARPAKMVKAHKKWSEGMAKKRAQRVKKTLERRADLG